MYIDYFILVSVTSQNIIEISGFSECNFCVHVETVRN